jgi:hypothetical protein
MDDWLPARPTLLPGLRVTRRDDHHLQVGFDPARRVVLPEHPAVRRLLADLELGHRPDLATLDARRAAHALAEHGLLVDADDLARHLAGPLPRPAVLASFAQHGASARSRLDLRQQARVGVVADEPWRAAVLRLLGSAGVAVAGPREAATAVVLVAAGGEPPRGDLDRFVRGDVPHLPVRNVGARPTVGPMVVPGLTACLRCVDAHASDLDPGHGMLVEQHDPVADEPCDPLLMHLAVLWAVCDLVTYVEGGLPATWSATVDVDPALALERREWTRHPRCGCSWGDYQYSESSLPSMARRWVREQSSQK